MTHSNRKPTDTKIEVRKGQYEDMLPRLLNAVTGMASGTGSLRERLALAVCDVCVFADSQVPAGLLPTYRAFSELVHSPTVHPAYLAHPHPAKSSPAFYLTPAKARRAAELLTSMLETVAYRQDWTEDELRDMEAEDVAQLERENPSKRNRTKHHG